MSAFIGSARGPRHNSPYDAAEVWCSPRAVELSLFSGNGSEPTEDGVSRSLDPIAARNLAALLIRAAAEAERMAGEPHP
jgi:hypothetical protein